MADCVLERVVSVKQISMAATGLPLELQQQIFGYLDTKTFYAARKVCRYWHFASTDSLPLAKQLRKLPILPPVEASDATPTHLQELYDEATRTLMVGVHAERAFDRPGTFTRVSKMGFPISSRVSATSCGSKTVTLNGRTIALFDTSGETAICLAQRPINDLKEAVGSGPWLRSSPNAYNELALSSDGRLLAIAQERTIQIYDLLAEPDSFTINQYISSATGHYICGLDFEMDDYVMRVRLSGKGAVLYLGTPPAAVRGGQEKASLEHWKSKAGLRHTFLDSSLLSIKMDEVEEETATTADHTAKLAGVQILQAFENGYLFAGQRHGGGESSHYILGHVKTNTNTETLATAEHSSVTLLARLESFLSSWDFTLSAEESSSSNNGMGLWENMPSAHEHHPRFALDLKNGFLALAERDKKRIRPAPLCQLFIYRIPTERELEAQRRGRESVTRAMRRSFLDGLQRTQAQQQEPRMQYRVPRVPLCLSTIQGDISELVFTQHAASTTSPPDVQQPRAACSISAATVDSVRTWHLQDV